MSFDNFSTIAVLSPVHTGDKVEFCTVEVDKVDRVALVPYTGDKVDRIGDSRCCCQCVPGFTAPDDKSGKHNVWKCRTPLVSMVNRRTSLFNLDVSMSDFNASIVTAAALTSDVNGRMDRYGVVRLREKHGPWSRVILTNLLSTARQHWDVFVILAQDINIQAYLLSRLSTVADIIVIIDEII